MRFVELLQDLTELCGEGGEIFGGVGLPRLADDHDDGRLARDGEAEEPVEEDEGDLELAAEGRQEGGPVVAHDREDRGLAEEVDRGDGDVVLDGDAQVARAGLDVDALSVGVDHEHLGDAAHDEAAGGALLEGADHVGLGGALGAEPAEDVADDGDPGEDGGGEAVDGVAGLDLVDDEEGEQGAHGEDAVGELCEEHLRLVEQGLAVLEDEGEVEVVEPHLPDAQVDEPGPARHAAGEQREREVQQQEAHEGQPPERRAEVARKRQEHEERRHRDVVEPNQEPQRQHRQPSLQKIRAIRSSKTNQI